MKIVRHSLVMIKRTYKNYILLSVTAVLSFTIMFLYLIFMDSNIYNEYREILGSDSSVILSYNEYSDITMRNINMLSKQLDELSDTHYYYIQSTYGTNMYGGQNCEIDIIPRYIWGIFDIGLAGENDKYTYVSRIMVNNQYEISLKIDEAIVSKALYEYLCSEQDVPKIKIVFKDKNGKNILRSYKVIGYYEKEDNYSSPENDNVGDKIYISDSSVAESCEISNIVMVIQTDNIQLVNEQIKKLNLSYINSMSDKNDAIDAKNLVVKNKYIIAVILFMLLGINLYSSFMNALNDRKFEIGVKRALGASKLNIMWQFVTEGIVVMFLNIFLSITIGMTTMTVYKFVRLKIDNYIYVVSINTESMILFFIFTSFLAVILSLLFAYKSTCVEIVKYLKEEL